MNKERGKSMGWSEQVERNLKAMEYEQNGDIKEAIGLYEMNVAEAFEGTHPYQRLCDLYVGLDQKDDLIRVLEKAISVFEGAQSGDCKDKYDQLQRFKQTYVNVTKTFNEVN